MGKIHYRKKLPMTRKSICHRFSINGFEGYVHWGFYPNGLPGELFITASKQGSTLDGCLDAIAILTSLALQYGVPLEDLIEKMKGRRFDPAGMTDNPGIGRATSILDYIFRWAENHLLGKQQIFASEGVVEEGGGSGGGAVTESATDLTFEEAETVESKEAETTLLRIQELRQRREQEMQDNLKPGIRAEVPKPQSLPQPSGSLCHCGSILISQGGCLVCPSCGWSQC